MTDLNNYQFELGGVVFGYGAAVATDEDGFDPGSDSYTTQDSDRSSTDSIAFGEDSRKPGLWTWNLYTATAEFPEDAVYDLAALGREWRGESYRRTPSKVAELRYRIADRTRVVYGRARNWSDTMNNKMLSGLIEADCEFQRADTLFYDDAFQSTPVSIVPAEPRGLVSPIISPITTLAGEPRHGTIALVGGDVPAPFIATINGPVLNPKISGIGWELELLVNLGAGQSVRLSTYPWELRAIRNDGANLSGMLSAKSRLSKARLDPAGEDLYFDGTDGTGAASCVVQWRPAYITM